MANFLLLLILPCALCKSKLKPEGSRTGQSNYFKWETCFIRYNMA